MDSSNLIKRIRSRLNFLSSNGDEYKWTVDSGGDLLDSRYQFNVYIEGKVSELHCTLINQAVVYTWNLTAYQTKNFVNFFMRGYQFMFVPRARILVDADGKLQTKLAYFITASSNGRLAAQDDFDLVPRASWLQDSFAKYDLPYVVLDQDTEPAAAYHHARDYDKLYYVDFDSYIDPTDEDDIGSAILACFRRIYIGLIFFPFYFIINI